MRLPFEIFLALRYLRPKRTFVSVITLISIVGVTLGVAVLITVISVMTGFDRHLKETLMGFEPHLMIHNEGLVPLSDYREIAQIVQEHPDVIEGGCTPSVMTVILLDREDGDYSIPRTPALFGIDPSAKSVEDQLKHHILFGDYDIRGNGVMLGRELARQLGVGIGSSVSMLSGKDLKRLVDEAEANSGYVPVPDDYEVTGIFDAGYYQFNSDVVFSSIGNAQEIAGIEEDAVHFLRVMVNDPFDCNRIQAEISEMLGGRYAVSTWTENNGYLIDAIAVEKMVMFYILFFIMIVAAFGIMGTLIAFVVQKTREVGILKAIGASRLQVMMLFISQGVLVGVLGVVAGFGLGVAMVEYRNQFLAFLRRTTNIEIFPAEIYGFGELPAMIVPGDIAIICGGALIMCLLAGLIPAWNAGRLQPVEALRHE